MTSRFNDTLSALSDPTRRAILEQLRCGELRVTDIAAPHEMSLNAVSKHIKKLEAAELITRRKEGRVHYLSVNPVPLTDAADWFDQQRSFWTQRFDQLEALIEQEKNHDQ